MVGAIATPLKNMSSSVGMMTFPIYIYIYIWKVIKFMFQTTNQISTLWLFNIAMGNGP